MPKSGAYLGFDFGTKRIGIALGDTITQTARPLTTLSANNGTPDPKAIATLVSTWNPVGFVTGLPLMPSGEKGTIAHVATKFANRLQAAFDRPSFTIDERMTTQVARLDRSEHGIDAVAAAIILEAWLKTAFTP